MGSVLASPDLKHVLLTVWQLHVGSGAGTWERPRQALSWRVPAPSLGVPVCAVEVLVSAA